MAEMQTHEIPGWLAVGAKVAVYTVAYDGRGSVRWAWVVRHTKTQVVVHHAGGVERRFRLGGRGRLTPVGSDRNHRTELLPPDAPEVLAVVRQATVRQAMGALVSIIAELQTGARIYTVDPPAALVNATRIRDAAAKAVEALTPVVAAMDTERTGEG